MIPSNALDVLCAKFHYFLLNILQVASMNSDTEEWAGALHKIVFYNVFYRP